MKKIFTFLVCISLNHLTYAGNLQCEKSYAEFNKYLTDLNNIGKNGDAEQLDKFLEQKEYSRLFKVKHQNQVYYDTDWMDKQEYQLALQFQEGLMRSDQYQHIKFSLQSPKANFILSVGEICVVPWTSEDKIFNKTYVSQTDLIFVRDLNTNQWRSFAYLGTEKPEDFKEFFPNFPLALKLSAATANGTYAVTDQAYEMGINMFDYLTKSKIPPVLIEELTKNVELNRQRLKANGFD
jgi:hypothetical protein